jgi:hypothetical protein
MGRNPTHPGISPAPPPFIFFSARPSCLDSGPPLIPACPSEEPSRPLSTPPVTQWPNSPRRAQHPGRAPALGWMNRYAAAHRVPPVADCWADPVPAPGLPLFRAALVPASDSAPNAQLPSFARQPQNPSRRLIPNETHHEIFHKSTMNSSRIFDSVVGDIRHVVPLVMDSLAYK